MYEKILLSVLTTFVAVVLAACGGNSDSKTLNSLDKIKQNGVVRIGVFGDKPPFGYVDEKGNNQGYDIALAKRIAKELLAMKIRCNLFLLKLQIGLSF